MSDPVTRLNAALEGRYRIERELGEGGMANVYLADDLRHERKVALKVLKPELAAVVGAERFLAEIKTTANLQHPHILPLFDSGEADSFLFYVMPYMQGESLRERLDREHQLPVDETVRIATNLAEALDYAHRQGVIHRDIKPANILLQAGKPVISDFGIALAVGAAGGGRLTETGLSLGTPHYMSPEQATGDLSVGAASDIYAVGCVLYEMLVGEPPFTGSTPQAVLGKIVTGDAPSAIDERRSVPPNVDAAIRRALEKVPADRFAGAQALADALRDPSFGHAPDSGLGRAPPTRSGAGRVLPWGVAAALASALVAVAFGGPEPGPAVYDVGLPVDAPMAFTGGSPDGVGWPAISLAPSGDFFVYTAEREGTTELWYRSLPDTDARPIDGTLGGFAPMVSPDGTLVAFFAEGQLRTVPIAGGDPVRIMDVEPFSFSGHWPSMERIVVHDRGGARMRAVDPTVRAVIEEAQLTQCLLPFETGSGRALCNETPPYKARLREPDGTMVDLLQAGQNVFGSNFRLIAPGYVSFVTPEGALQVATLDPETAEIGRPATVVQGLRREGVSGASHYAVTPSGALVYVPGANGEVGRMVRVGPEGTPTPLPMDPGAFLTYDLSPDGERLAAVMVAIGRLEVRVFDLGAGGSSRWLASTLLAEPRWSPSGSRLAVGDFSDLDRPVLVIGDPGTPAAVDTVGSGAPSAFFEESAVLMETQPAGALVLDLDQSPAAEVGRIDDLQFGAAVSPDGRRVAYVPVTEIAGLYVVVVQSFPEGGERRTVTPQGGQEPIWLSNSEIAFRLERSWYRVSVTDESVPRLWFRDDRFVDTPGRSQAPSRDGGVIYVQAMGPSTGSYLRVINGWLEEAMRAADEANGP